ncbi:class I SAM-dependent methyltransferase [Pseudidiomarina sp. E22-M8]|uniref:class I SAM-dependent methyltransferase n=1 Tax=Pseudidiomarina sp. E22-M8 TaxID=3424768 RepID=UPI00403D18A1
MEHWSKYWHTAGVLNSFAEGDANSGYTGELKKFWEQQLNDVPQGATVVDLGTGNGALALLARDFSVTNQKDFSVHGVDAAQIDPVKQFEKSPALAKKLKKISFHSETPIESLPFDEGSIDVMIAQFAFEYADRNDALKEVLQTLKSGGKLVTVMHHNDSEMVKDSKIGVAVLTEILENSPVFQQSDMLLDLASQAIPQIGAEGWESYPHNQILTRSIQWTMKTLQEKFSKPAELNYVNDVVRRIARIFEVMNAENLNACKRQLAFEYHLLNDHRLRLKDQLTATLTKKDANTIVKAAEKAGASAKLDVLTINDTPFGWTLTLIK